MTFSIPTLKISFKPSDPSTANNDWLLSLGSHKTRREGKQDNLFSASCEFKTVISHDRFLRLSFNLSSSHSV